MTSLTQADLVAEVSGLIGDPTNLTFTITQIKDWINQAIRDLSIHFPKYEDYQINTALNDHDYDLETYIKGVVSVEYPVGQTPPRFLQRRNYTDPKFYKEPGYYDFVKSQSSDDSTPPQVYVSDATPAGVNLLKLRVTRDHNLLFDPGDECTLMERHYHLIGLFVRWKALSERSMHESMDPSPLAMRASLMENATLKAENAYNSALARALAAETESAQISWKMDRFDGAY